MRREEQVRQIKVLLAHLDSGTTVDAGGLRRNPTSVYVDADLAEHPRGVLAIGFVFAVEPVLEEIGAGQHPVESTVTDQARHRRGLFGDCD